MMVDVDIDALKSKFTGIPEEYSFKSFLAIANIKEGAYGFISRVLLKNQETILLSLTKDEKKVLESRVGGTVGLSNKLTVSELARRYAPDVWPEIVEISKDSWSENNKQMMSNYNSIKTMLEKGRQLCFIVSDQEIATTISEFIDAIVSHENEEERNQQLLYIDSLLSIILSGGNIGRDFDSKFNHDRIPRIIARYFFNYTTADFWNKRGYTSRDAVGNSLKQENTNYSTIIHYIHTMLNGVDGSGSQWFRMWGFLDVLRILRNYVDHYQPYITNDNERLTAAQFILYTFVGTYYAIKQNLLSCNVDNNVLKDKNPWTMTKTKTLCVYYNDQPNKDFTENDKAFVKSVLPQIKLFKKDQEFIPQLGNMKEGCIEFKLEEGEEYCIKFGDHNPVNVPKELIWESPGGRPVVIWNNVTPYFFRDLSTVNAELRPYIEAAHEAAIENNTEATKELTGTIEVLSSRMAMFEQDIKQGLIDNAGVIAETMKAMTEAILLLQKTLAEISAPQKKAKRLKPGYIIVALALLLLVLFFVCNSLGLFQSSVSPEALIIKGDQYLKDYNPQEAGISYRKAIRLYEEELLKDSNDIKANLGLATMLMRGKGDYDLHRAERLARNANGDRRGEGLYLYLLVVNGNPEKADSLICAMDSTEMTDEYAQLADALMTIYGYNERKRTLENTKEAAEVMMGLHIQEALLEMADILKNGIRREKTDDAYYINPDPIVGASCLSNLAVDSLNPVSMGMLGDFLYAIGEIEASLDNTYIAWKCGINECAPILRVRFIEIGGVQLTIEDPKVQTIWEEVSRESRHQGTLGADISNYVQEQHNWLKNRIPAKQLLKSMDALIASIEEDKSEVYKPLLDKFYHARVSLCLETGNLERAVNLVRSMDTYKDSLAIADYLMGICYAKGFGDIPIDTLIGDSLIDEAAKRGYADAIYSRLRRATPLTYYIEKRKNQWSQCREVTYSEDAYDSRRIKLDRNVFDENGNQIDFIDLGEIWSITDGGPMVKTNPDGSKTYYVFHYKASKLANVTDSIWQSSPKLAMEMADYWRDYYRPRPFNESIFGYDSPYLEYCPKEYQTLCETIEMCYENYEVDGETYFKTKELPKAILVERLFWLQVRIASAIEKGDRLMARHLITVWVSLAQDTDIDYRMLETYSQFALPDFKKERKFVPYLKVDYPVYAY